MSPLPGVILYGMRVPVAVWLDCALLCPYVYFTFIAAAAAAADVSRDSRSQLRVTGRRRSRTTLHVETGCRHRRRHR